MKPTSAQIVAAAVLLLAAAWTAFSVLSLGDRVKAVELILKSRLIDEAVVACNRAATADGRDERFTRAAVSSARFVLWYLDTPTREPSADMHIYSSASLGCRFGFLGSADVYALVER